MTPDKEKLVALLKKLAAKADAVYLAPDPDREGEAIAAHLANAAQALGKVGTEIRRVTFNEITKKAVVDAFKHARDIDENLVDAQQTRRVLDRIVGYQISPLTVGQGAPRSSPRGACRPLRCGSLLSVSARSRLSIPSSIGQLMRHSRPCPRPGVCCALRRHRRREGRSTNGQRRRACQIRTRRQMPCRRLKRPPGTYGQWRKRNAAGLPPAPFITSKLQQDASRKLELQRQTHHGRGAAIV